MIDDEIRWTGQSAQSQVQLYKCVGSDPRRRQTRSDRASHSFVASAGICNPGDLSCAELSVFRLPPQRSSFHSPSQPVEWASGKIHFHSERYLSCIQFFFLPFLSLFDWKVRKQTKNNYRGERGIGSVICQSDVHYMHSVFTHKYDWITHKYNWF